MTGGTGFACAGAFGTAGGTFAAGGAPFDGATAGGGGLKATAGLTRRTGDRADGTGPARLVISIVIVHHGHRDLRGSTGRCAEAERAALVAGVLAARVGLRAGRGAVTQRRVRIGSGGHGHFPFLPAALPRFFAAVFWPGLSTFWAKRA